MSRGFEPSKKGVEMTGMLVPLGAAMITFII